MRVEVFVAGFVAVVVALSVASPASAQDLTVAGEASVDEVADLAYAGGTTATRPPVGDPALVDQWRTRELQLRGTAGSGPSVSSELEGLRRVGKVKWGFRILGRASLVATAGQVGWEIGSVIADEIYEDELPSRADMPGWDPSYSEVMAVQKGDCIQFVGLSSAPTRQGMTDAEAQQSCTSGGGVSDSLTVPETLRAPADGWVLVLGDADWSPRAYATVQYGPGPEGELASRLKAGWEMRHIDFCRQVHFPLAANGPAGFAAVGATTGTGSPWYKAEPSTAGCVWDAVTPSFISARPYVWFKPTTGSSRPLTPGEDPPGDPIVGQVPDPGRANVEQTVRENLCNAAYRRVANFIANQLGEAVCEGQVQIPACRGDAVATCTEALQARGITDYLVEDAPVEEADPTIAPEDALGTEPPADSWIDSGEQVVVRRNPQPPIIDTPDDGERDERCETATQYDPQPQGADMFTLVIEEPSYWTAENPDDGGLISIPFHYGSPYPSAQQGQWGFRHIAIKHGWDEGVAVRIANALVRAAGPSGTESGSRREADGSLTYWYQFVHPQTDDHCTQIVRAREQPKPGEDETLGIITSYAKHGWTVPPPR